MGIEHVPGIDLAYRTYLSANMTLFSHIPIGQQIFEREWDVLVLLDTCRVDALEEISEEYSFIGDIESVWSRGGSSPEWIAQTFDESNLDEIETTAYVSANAWAGRVINERSTPEDHLKARFAKTRWNVVSEGDFYLLDHAWEFEPQGEYGPVGGYPPARYVTDRGIKVWREKTPKRLILHYNQPHSPYLTNAFFEDRPPEEYEAKPFQYLRAGGDRENVWNAYVDELRYVLDDVELLLENVAAESVVISADHGEAFGEWGIYGHRAGSLHPYIRTVPWVKTAGRDTEAYETEFDGRSERTGTIEDNLSALGYV